MAYFDLHCHPGLKTLFQIQDGTQLSVWEDLSTGAMGKVLGSQSSFNQVTEKGDTNLVCLTLHPPEKGMINQFVIFLAALTVVKKALSFERLKQMCASDCLYQAIFYQELSNVQSSSGALKQVVFLKDWSEYKKDDYATLYVIFNIEGGHSFYDMGNKVGSMTSVLANFKAFLDLGYKTLYFTPTHLTPNEFVTHAYGNKILSKGLLLPKGIGITQKGLSILNFAHENGILIDIKHMSLVSRRIYYQWRKLAGITSPIVASHIGLSGDSWTSAFKPAPSFKEKSYGYKISRQRISGSISGTFFYPLTINLYDEDVKEIIKSNGLIGISLDVRILGGSKNDLVKDFLSLEEFKLLCSTNVGAEIDRLAGDLYNGGMHNGNSLLDTKDLQAEDADDITDATDEIKDLLGSSEPVKKLAHFQQHLDLVANHIIRIFEICEWTSAGDPSANICIGSDFDGLIEPLDCCRNASQFDSFSVGLKLTLKAHASKLPKLQVQDIDTDKLVEDLMYNNALAFLNRHWK